MPDTGLADTGAGGTFTDPMAEFNLLTFHPLRSSLSYFQSSWFSYSHRMGFNTRIPDRLKKSGKV